MAKGYWIVRVDIEDMEQYKTYIAANAAPFKKYGARFLVRGGKYENPEGASRERNAVIEFPSYAAALECWRSPEYQAALRLREPVSTADLVIIATFADVIRARQRFSVDLLYSDHEGGQRAVTRFGIVPVESSDAWFGAVTKHWRIDGVDPR